MNESDKPPVSRMIINVQPELLFSMDIDRILENFEKPGVRWNFTVQITIDQMKHLLEWMVDGVLHRENERIKAGKSTVPVQLMIEFKRAIEAIMERAQ